jgi:hypothetical protein
LQSTLLLLPSSGGESVGDATGLAAVEAEPVASSCTAPDEPAVVEHPAAEAVTSTSPTVSSFKRVLIAFPNL